VKHVRVFVSSPSDVDHERRRVERVIGRLNSAFLGQVRFDAIRWETSFYSAHQTFQAQIPEAEDCDIVIAILWSRLGSELPPGFPPMADGQPYPSGTAYEVLSAIRARETKDLPDIYVFRKTAQPLFAIDREDELLVARAQWIKLRDFFERWFVSSKGHIRAAFHTFDTTDVFEEHVEALLRAWAENHVLGGRSAIWPIKQRGSPFRGLAPFDFDAAQVFFGRSRSVSLAIERLVEAKDRGQPFLLVLGPSGAGKSSLVRAGLAPRLTAPGVIDQVDLWRIAIFAPSDHSTPAEALVQALYDVSTAYGGLPELAQGDYTKAEELAELVRSGSSLVSKPIERALQRAAENEQKDQSTEKPIRPALLLVVDQLDDLFLDSVTPANRDAFSSLLISLMETGLVWVVATLRAALVENVLLDQRLVGLKERGSSYDLSFPGPADLADIVRLPALAAGLLYERGPTGETLDEVLLRDAIDPDSLPLLQFTLQRLFDERREDGSQTTLTFSAYEKNGGIDGAIDQAAQRALEDLDKTDIGTLPRILRQLAAPIRDSRQTISSRSTLAIRPAPLASLANSPAAKRVVDALIDARILFVSVEGLTPIVRLAHQRVLQSWQRASEIIESQGEFYRVRSEIAAQTMRWKDGNRRTDLLLPFGLALAEAEEIVRRYGDEISEDERTFVDISGRRARKTQRLTMAAAVVFGVVAIASIALGLITEREAVVAQDNYQVARQAADGLIVDIAGGLRNVEGMPTASVKRILATAKSVIDRLTLHAPDDIDLAESRVVMLRQFATNYAALGDLVSAKDFAENSVADARRILIARPNDHSLDLLAVSLNALGRVLQTKGALDEAQAAYDEALSISRNLSAAPASQNRGDAIQARTLNLAIDLDVVRGDRLKGLAASAQATDLSRKLVKVDPANVVWQTLLADSLEHSGNINAGVQTAYTGPTQLDPALPSALPGIDHQAALAELNEAGDIIAKQIQRDPTNTDLSARLENIFIRISDLMAVMGKFDEALAKQKEALAISSNLLSKDTGNTEWKRRVEVNDTKIRGFYLVLHNPDAALSASREALGIATSLSELDPSNILWGRDLCAAYRALGSAQRPLKQLAEARDSYDKAIAACRATLARSPSENSLKVDLVFTLYSAGKGPERPIESEISFMQEALSILDELVQAGALPSACENWPPFIRAKLDALIAQKNGAK
jgi:tetratricopeptide (TPR) repeat protein